MYNDLNLTIPFEKRKEINNKILHVIDNNLDLPSITPEVIFNSYTGAGGLHGLNYSDYDNYHQFKVAKQGEEHGAFFTPFKLAKLMIDILQPSKHDLISDMTAGHGALINGLPNEENVYVNELDLKSYKVLKYLFPKANVTNNDIRLYEPPVFFDIVLGNPPFNLEFSTDEETMTSQFYYMKKAHRYLKPAGLLAFIVPNSFLSDDFTDSGHIEFTNKLYNHIHTFVLPSNIFYETGANIDTKIVIFQKKSEFVPEQEYDIDRKKEIKKLTKATANAIYKKFIQPLYEQKNKVKNKIILETSKQNKEEEEFYSQVKKLLFDIKRTKKTASKYNKAESYVMKYREQKQPDGMDYSEWMKVRITKKKVLSYLKRILRDQHVVPKDEIRVVKTRTSIKRKAYSPKAKIHLSKMNAQKEVSFHDAIDGYGDNVLRNPFKKLINKKRREYLKQSVNFNEMSDSPAIMKWLEDFTINDSVNNQNIKLNKIQKYDTMRMLQKNYGYLQWGTGSGKSVSMVAQFAYRMEHNNIRNTFIVAPAIAINNNWHDILQSYGYDVLRINSMKDVMNIKRGQIVILTFGMLVKYRKQIKKYIKMQSNKIMFCLDEADSICNPSSRRTKAVFDCFSNAKYKLLASATSTRNNIPESFTAFSFLYKSSINFISECEVIYVEDKKSKEIKEVPNKLYNQPFLMYKKGHTLFKRCFSPEKVTVFGVGKQNQDIYHGELLTRLINKTMITRTFEEVSGKNLYEIVQNTCSFNDAENEVYRVIIEEFYRLSDMYKSTGNHRKDALLRIIQQLNSLLRACVTPNIFKEYKSTEMPSKAVKTLDMIGKWKNEWVVIGATHVKTVNQYARYIKENYPDRPLFKITGDSTTLNKRKAIIKKLEASGDGILICTQQSLSSSMNIDFVNKVLLVELMYNFASMHQFFARFVRYTSTEQKEIHFLTAANTIESNLLKLIMSKEKLNNFMKNNFIDDDEIMEQFGVDFDIISMLLSKETDEEGKSYIQWGKQQVM